MFEACLSVCVCVCVFIVEARMRPSFPHWNVYELVRDAFRQAAGGPDDSHVDSSASNGRVSPAQYCAAPMEMRRQPTDDALP